MFLRLLSVIILFSCMIYFANVVITNVFGLFFLAYLSFIYHCKEKVKQLIPISSASPYSNPNKHKSKDKNQQ